MIFNDLNIIYSSQSKINGMISVTEFTISLYEEMELRLSEINITDMTHLQNSKLSSGVILNFISKLKTYVHSYNFFTKEEEINFFKHLKPKFYSKLIYHQKVVNIQSHLPMGIMQDIKNYYLNELKKINDYFNSNHEFVTYHRSLRRLA